MKKGGSEMIIFYTRRFSDKIIVFIVALVITLLVAALTFGYYTQT